MSNGVAAEPSPSRPLALALPALILAAIAVAIFVAVAGLHLPLVPTMLVAAPISIFLTIAVRE